MRKLVFVLVLASIFVPAALSRTTVSISGTDCMAALPLPFTEDFTGVAAGEIPAGWYRTHSNWGVDETNYAGGASPEMIFASDPYGGTTQYRLITPLLDGTSTSNVELTFKYYVVDDDGDYILRVQTSTDDGATWQNHWSLPGGSCSGEALVTLDTAAGHEFLLAFVFDGDSYEIDWWSIDDIRVDETRRLDMLVPGGNGAVGPGVGKHDFGLGKDVTLGAVPSSTWYAFSLYPNSNPFKFDPANTGSVFYIGANDQDVLGGTWADGKWYVVSYDPCNLFTVDPANGAMTLIGSTGQDDLNGLAYDELNNIMYACSDTRLFTIDRTTGEAVQIAPIGSEYRIVDIAYGDGVLYAHSFAGDCIYTIDVDTGAATLLGPTGVDAEYAQGMEYDKDHGRLYLALADKDLAYLAEVDKTNGRVNIIFTFDQTEEVDGFAIPYGIDHPWEFDRWEVDGVFYSDTPSTTLVMDTDHSAQAFFTTSFPTYTMTMLAPSGAGGTVTPIPGTYIYADGTSAYITAVPGYGSDFDRWEVDSTFYSSSPCAELVMEADHTVKAVFKKQQPHVLPFCEDFSGIEEYEIPPDWKRSHTNWGVVDSSFAGGDQPEMEFSWYPPTGVGIYRLVTPLLDGTSVSNVILTFMHYVFNDYGGYTLRIQTTTNSGETWQDHWSMLGDDATYDSAEIVINLDTVAGQEFMIAFVFDGDPFNIDSWLIDNICVVEANELDMLNPVGRGAVVPSVGKHCLPIGQEITLGAVPSSNWYAFDLYPYKSPFVFDPADSGLVTYLEVGDISTMRGGTWAAGMWYAVSNSPNNLYTVNPADGALTLLGTTGSTALTGIAYDEVNDIMYASTLTALHTIDRSTGQTALVGSFGSSFRMIDIAYGDGILYGHCIASDSIYTIDVGTGAPGLLGPTGIDAAGAQGMEYDKDQGRLFLALTDLNYAYLAEVDKTNGSIYTLFEFDKIIQVDGFAIPYGTDIPWEFDHWEIDGVRFNDPVNTVIMNSNHNAQAFFRTSYSTYTLTMLDPGGLGAVSVWPLVGTHTYVANSSARLWAVSDHGFMLDYWDVDGTYYSSNPIETILMNGDHTIRAIFAVDPKLLCDPGDLFAQPVDKMQYYIESDANSGWIAADDFTGVTEPIYGIDFWGAELKYQSGWKACTKTSLDYIVRFYEYGPLPGNLVHEETVTVTKEVLTQHLNDDPQKGHVYKYSGMLSAPIAISDGWFSVQAVDSGSCFFNWVDAGPLIGYRDYDAAQRENGDWEYYGNSFNLAFCLLGEPPEVTPTPTATKPPEPTATKPPEPTATEPPGPTATPSATQPPEPTLTPTPTATKPPEPTATEPPEPTSTPTPGYPLGVRLKMPDMAHPGEEFSIIGYLDNPGESMTDVATFFILEVYGKFWFWPSWAYFDYPEYAEIDWENIDVPTGMTEIVVIPTFEWPDTGQDIVTGLGFYGAMLNPEMNDIMGGFAFKEWGYGPSR